MNVVARVHFKITDTTLNAELAEIAEPIKLGEFCLSTVAQGIPSGVEGCGLCVDRR